MRVGIVGGGISGLSCAYYLERAGVEPVVFDPAPGGLIGTVHVHGCTLETGPVPAFPTGVGPVPPPRGEIRASRLRMSRITYVKIFGHQTLRGSGPRGPAPPVRQTSTYRKRS